KTDDETRKLREAFINTGYMKDMPLDIKEGIIRHGIRNSHLLTVAPTGSTGTMIRVTTGLEPYFSFSYYRSGRLGKFIEVKADIVEEYLESHPEMRDQPLPEWFVTAMDLSPEAHADTQCVIQRWIDSSISKTVNAPKGYTVSEVESVYERLYHGGAKAGTVYVDGSRDTQGVIQRLIDSSISKTVNAPKGYTVSEVESVYERLYHGGAKGGTVYVDGSRDTQVLTLKAEETDMDEQLSFDEALSDDLDEENERKVVLMDTIQELENTNVAVGSEAGDRCPVCREGHVAEIGGCNTC